MAEIVRLDDPVEACGAAVAQAVIELDRQHGRARLAIAGGSALACVEPARRLMGAEVWSRLALTWADERCVPLDDPRSNRGAAHRAGLAGVALELPLFLDGERPEQAVARATGEFEQRFFGVIDVALLGVGPDGHMASLFVGHPALSEAGPLIHVADSPKPPPDRITFSLSVLSFSRVLALARGEDKRAAVHDLARGRGLLDKLRLFTDTSTR